MKISKLKRLCAVALSITLTLSVFAGCGNNNEADSSKEKLVFNLGEDPETIDPTLNTSSGASTIIVNAFEGLMRLDENEKAVPGIAKELNVSEDGLIYTFNLRDDAKWSDGKPVTAKDFEYSWVRALTKETGAEYCYQLFYIKNGEAFYEGNVTRDELGIKVVNDYTLEVTLESPTDYFAELTAFPTLMPLREDIVSANPDGWANGAESYISNGPFKLTNWEMKSKLTFEKNEYYWDKDSVKLDKLTYELVTDQDSAYASLVAGDFDMIDAVPPAMIEEGKKSGLVDIGPYLGTYFFAINVGKNDNMDPAVKEFLSDKRVRKALSIAVDRAGIVKNVTKAEQVPAYGFVPQGIPKSNGEEFANVEYYDATKVAVDEAKALLKEAGYGEGGKNIPTIDIMYNSEGAHSLVSQVIQQNWNAIGVQTTLSNQEWKVFLNTRQDGDYQIARHGWIGDYVDPMTFLDMWTTDNGNNDCGFSNSEYDNLISSAKKENDSVKREEMLKKAEDILMDEMPIIPLYFYTKVRGMKPEVKGVQSSTLGQVYFRTAYMEK